MSIHNDVLGNIGNIKIDISGINYSICTEINNGRIYLPIRMGNENRKTNLIYADAIINRGDKPVSVLEVVYSSPVDPNGITGHIINVDRCCDMSPSLKGIIYIVISSMKTYYCETCKCGHKFSSDKHDHFISSCKKNKEKIENILHDGPAYNYLKALKEYEITKYLKNIKKISVGFINENIDSIQNNEVTDRIEKYIKCHLGEKSNNPVFYGIEELIPIEYR